MSWIWDWHVMLTWGLKPLLYPPRQVLLGIKNIHCLVNEQPSQPWWECHLRRTGLLLGLHFSTIRLCCSSCCFNGHRGTGLRVPQGLFVMRRVWDPGVTVGSWTFFHSADAITWHVEAAWSAGSVCLSRAPYPGLWKAETLRTFHLDKMHLIRAMENGKPGLGKGNVLFRVKQTKNVTVGSIQKIRWPGG